MIVQCPCCAGSNTAYAFSTSPMPVAAALLVFNAEESCNLPKRSLDLWHCSTCGFLWNISFESALVRYDCYYEGTQIHSPHFVRYLDELANIWAARFSPETRRVIEVGCGQGEFLEALSSQITAKLIGYDPAIREGPRYKNIEMHATSLPNPSTTSQRADIILSRMTLEHIDNPVEFLAQKQRWLTPQGIMAVQVPNAARTFAQAEVCELQYEHVNYFTPAALIALVERLGLKLVISEVDYADQHLSIFAQHSTSLAVQPVEAQVLSIDKLRQKQLLFGANWHTRLQAANQAGQKVWLWGAGSRATAFCANLPDPSLIAGAIDLNPARQGSFVPGVNIQTYTPDHLAGQSNLCIVVMNSVYLKEISENLASMNCKAAYCCV